MSEDPMCALLLNLVLWLPLLGVGLLLLVPRGNDRLVRLLTVAVMSVQFLMTVVLYRAFDGTTAGLQFIIGNYYSKLSREC